MKKSEDEMERNKRPGLWKDGNSAHSRGGQKVESVVVKVGSVNVKLNAEEVGWNQDFQLHPNNNRSGSLQNRPHR